MLKKLLTLVICLITVLSSPNFIYGLAEVKPSVSVAQVSSTQDQEIAQKRAAVLKKVEEVDRFMKEFANSHPSKDFRVEDAVVILGAMEGKIKTVDTLEKLQLMDDYISFYVIEYKLGFIAYNLKEKIADLESKKVDLTGERKQELEEKISEARKILEVLLPMHTALRGKGTEMFDKAYMGDKAGFEGLKAEFDEPTAKVKTHENLSEQLSQQYKNLKNSEDKLELVEKYEAMVIQKATEYKAKVDEAKTFLVKEERDAKKVEIDGVRRNVLLEFNRVVVETKNVMEANMQRILDEFEASVKATSDIVTYGQVKRVLQEYIDREATDKIKDDTDRRNIQNELLKKVDQLDSKDKVDELFKKIDKRIADPKSGSWASKNEDIINNPAVKDVTAGLAAGLHDGFKSQDNNASNSSVVPAKTEGAKKVRSVHKVSVPKTGV